MAISLGSQLVVKVYKGSTEVRRIYKGDVKYYDTYENETIALLARMTVQPNTALADLINVTIKGLKDAGVWSKLDCLYVRTLHTSQAACLNWIRDADNSTLVNSPVYVYLGGIKGNGSSSYINTNFNPYTDATQFTLTAAGIHYMVLSKNFTNTRYILGCTEAGIGSFYVIYYTSGDYCRTYLQSSTYNSLLANDPSVYHSANKNTPVTGGIQAYVNGNPVGVVTACGNSTRLNNLDVFEGCSNVNGVPSSFVYCRFAHSFYGGSLTASQELAFYNTMKYFQDNVLETESYGEEKIRNGGFDNSDNWLCQANWSISGGKANYDDAGNTKIYTSGYSVGIVAGKKYRVSFTISGLTTGSTYLGFQNNVSNYIFAEWPGYMYIDNNETFDAILTASYSVANVYIIGNVASGSSFSLDNLSIRELIE